MSGPSETEPDAIVRFDRVTKRFPTRKGEVLALREASFDVPRSAFVSLVGPSGCGKTTLLNMVAGLLEPTSGSIVLDGVPIDGPPEGLGLVLQQPTLLEWRNVVANIRLSTEIVGRRGPDVDRHIDELIDIVGLGEFRQAMPHELSGGMQQRVAIGRALAHSPSLLLMDEPFAALDAFTREEMSMELLRIWSATGKTIVFITHDIGEAVFLSDRIVVLAPRPGRVKEVVDIDLPRPRDSEVRFTKEFADYHHHVRSLIYEDRDCDKERTPNGTD
ncbi:MAG TPA: ABC transporter ATP-binding protein [Glycomyces sp.]|nr:ABC transporter ATP-binding protein [Glycomyces sp.]